MELTMDDPVSGRRPANEAFSGQQVVTDIVLPILLWASFVISIILTHLKIHCFFMLHLRNVYLCMIVSLTASVAATLCLFDLSGVVDHTTANKNRSSVTDEWLPPLLTISCLLSFAGGIRYYFSTFLGSFFLFYKLAIIGGALFWFLTLCLITHHQRLFSSDSQQNCHCQDLTLFYLLYTLQLIAVYVLVLALKKQFTSEWLYPNQSSSVYIADSADEENEERIPNATSDENGCEEDGCEETVDFAHKWRIVGYSHIGKEYIDSEIFFHSDYPASTFFLRLHPRKRYTSLYLHFSSADLEKVSIWLTCSVLRLGTLLGKIILEKKFKLLTVYSGECIGWYRFIDWEQYTLRHLTHLNCLYIICRIQGFKAEFAGDESFSDSVNRNVEAENFEEFFEPPLDALENID